MFENKIMSVFYGNDRLPYKDAQRSVHYPITSGNVFNGANNTTTIRFYVDRVGGTTGVQWVAKSKLPNGQIGYDILSNPQEDKELGEYYLDLDVSAYYTQQKGDIYFSLYGYAGDGNVEVDSDTGIIVVTGNPSIQVTGAIKLSINYAVQTLPGVYLGLDDLSKIMAALGNKSNVGDTILVVSNINSLDPSDYNDGQVFYLKETSEFYINDLDNNQIILMKEFVDTDTEQFITGQKYFQNGAVFQNKDLNLYNVRIKTNTKSRFARVGVTTDQYVNYDLPYNYSEKGNTTLTLGTKEDIQNLCVEVETANILYKVLSNSEYDIVQKHGGLIKLYSNGTPSANDGYYVKALEDSTTYTFVPVNQQVKVSSGTYTLPRKTLVVNKSSRTLTLTPFAETIYTKDQIDTIVATLNANTFQVVASLPVTGQEGIIYLVETSSGVYEQYIWESNGYIDLGSTQIDLSGYATTSYVDSTFVAKTSASSIVYGTDGSGNPTFVPYSSGATAGRLVQRVEDGQINVPNTPVNNTHAASKKYVDDSFVFATNTDIDNLF